MGLITPTGGEIRVFGRRIRPGAEVLSRIGSFVEGAGFLPHQICRGLRHGGSCDSMYRLIVDRDHRHLFVSRQRPDPTCCTLLMLEMLDHKSPRLSRTSRGLTRRESEVLHWLGKGKSNWDIGQILHLKPATVSKHLERIYPKLGVDNRTAASQSAC